MSPLRLCRFVLPGLAALAGLSFFHSFDASPATGSAPVLRGPMRASPVLPPSPALSAPAAFAARLRQLLAEPDPTLRGNTLKVLANTWAKAPGGPAAMIAAADRVPPSAAGAEARLALLREALPRWAAADPAAASRWLETRPPSPETDEGAAVLATFPALIKTRPDVALDWADSITDPDLRRVTLTSVLVAWSTTDRVAASEHLDALADLDPIERDQLRTSLAAASALPLAVPIQPRE